jgi:hypothetical protein
VGVSWVLPRIDGVALYVDFFFKKVKTLITQRKAEMKGIY